MEWDNPERPECTNLLNIYLACSGKSKSDIEAEVKVRYLCLTSHTIWSHRNDDIGGQLPGFERKFVDFGAKMLNIYLACSGKIRADIDEEGKVIMWKRFIAKLSIPVKNYHTYVQIQ